VATILIVEDERDMNNLIRSHLEQEGHTVYQAFDGPAGLALVEKQQPHLVILDWMLPGRDGLAICREIRQHHLTPIIMLTARSEEIDRVMGLEVGADDYIVKPFSIRELLARVRSILRRVALDTAMLIPGDRDNLPAEPDTQRTVPPAPAPVVRGPLQIDLADRMVALDGRQIDLTRREFDLLALLATHPGRAFSRDFLLEHLWGYEYDGADRTVDSHVAQVRRKLGAHGEKLTTVWGVGYRWKSDA
jgi:DNA-binding response OmpR family regulator